MEFAFVLPLLALIFFGTLDMCTMMFVRQAVSIAAHQASRLAVQEGATTAAVRDVCEEFLAQRGIRAATVETVPPEIQDAGQGEIVTIRLRVPLERVGLFLPRLYGQQTAALDFSAMKERRPQPQSSENPSR